MREADILAYVRATAQMLALPLDDARTQAVAQHLGRTLLLANQLEGFDLPLGEEMSEIFCPAAFSADDGDDQNGARA